MEWLPLAVLGIMWAAFLLPTRGRAPTPQGSVGDFERRMELLAQAETHGTEGRWIVTPRKGMRFMGPTERHRARARERRRQVFIFLLESIGITFMIGLVPPLRVAWTVTALFAALLGVYVWLLLTIKHRESTYRTAPHRHARSHAAPSRPAPRPGTWPRAATPAPARASTASARSARATASTWSCAPVEPPPAPDAAWTSTTSPATSTTGSTPPSPPASRRCPPPAARSEPAPTRSVPSTAASSSAPPS